MPDVDDHLAEQPDHDAEGHVPHERVLGPQRHLGRRVGDGEEQPDDQQGPDQSELLAEHREDEVGVRLGQVAPLLRRPPDPLAGPPAGGQRVQTVGRLPAGVEVVLERVDEVGQPLASLGARAGQVERHHPDDRAGEDEEPARRPDDPQHREQDREEHQRGAEVAAEHDEHDRREHARHHRDHHVVQLVEATLLERVDVGRPEHERQLGDLRGLDRQRPHAEPVGVAVDRDAQTGHLDQGEQHQRDGQPGPGEPAQGGVRQARGDPGGRDAQRHPHQLAPHDGVGVVVDPEGADARGAQHHDQADGEQQRRGAQQEVVRRERPVQGRAQGGPPGGGEPRRPAPASRPAWEAAPGTVTAGVVGVQGGHPAHLLDPLVVRCCYCVPPPARRRTAAAKASPRAA